MEKVLLILSNGKKVGGYYDEGDFDGIYKDWENGEVMAFLNCCVKGTEVIGMEYEDVPSDVPVSEIKPAPQDIKKAEYVLFRAEYEVFTDSSYYDMWCVKNKDNRRFDSPMSFHFVKYDDAEEFKRLIELAK